MRPHRSERRDANEAGIIEALIAVGASVDQLPGGGRPDLLVGFRGRTWLIEVKAPLGPQGGASHATLTDDQVEWWAAWRGERPVVVRTVDEALRAIGAVK